MIYELSKEYDANRAKARLNNLINSGKVIELVARKVNRTTKQSNSLHLYFEFIATELNEMGMEFTYEGIKGMSLSTRYTKEIVKDFIWRPSQLLMFGIESTKHINTEQINELIDVITKYFAEKGIEIPFPSIED